MYLAYFKINHLTYNDKWFLNEFKLSILKIQKINAKFKLNKYYITLITHARL